MECDVIVIGAGPAGLAFARGLVGSGLTVVLVERQSDPVLPTRSTTGARLHSRTAWSIRCARSEQGAATQAIVRSLARAPAGTDTVTANITDVALATEDTGAGASRVLSSATELARQAEQLRIEVQTFLASVRPA